MASALGLNIDSDEVLYYVDGDFMSRNHVEEGYISLHPAGIPHGPHPGAAERSIGKKATNELAVMVDTFAPLKITKNAINLSDGKYQERLENRHFDKIVVFKKKSHLQKLRHTNVSDLDHKFGVYNPFLP